MLLATSKTKKQNKPASLLHKSVMRKEFPRMAKAVVNQVFHEFVLLVNALMCSFSFYSIYVLDKH